MKKEVDVSGMNCSSCASGIEMFLNSQEGIEDAEVSYEEGTITIRYRDEVDLQEIWKSIQDMGYEVKA